MICPNCKAVHGCTCQALTASDGTSVCSACIQKYELANKGNKSLSNTNNPAGIPMGPLTPIVNSVTFNNLNN